MRNVGRLARDGWLMVGITLLAFLVLEAGYRAQGAIRSSSSSEPVVDSSLHPYVKTSWWGDVNRTRRKSLGAYRYDPYRAHWPLPIQSRYLNIDSAGLRVTIQPPGPYRRTLYMFGGSTMWGYTVRDSFTIPSLTAAALVERGIRDVGVVNLGQSAFNTTQELNTLLLQLAHGGRPAAAVFLDGFNDIATATQYGEPGHSYVEQSMAQQLALGRRSFSDELLGLGRHSALIQRLREAVVKEPSRKARRPSDYCGPVAENYRNTARMATAIGRGFGFSVAYFLQPVDGASGKVKSPWEKTIPTMSAMKPCLTSIDSAMAGSDVSFHSLLGLFDGDSATGFLDQYSHLTEEASRKVAETIADVIIPLLRAADSTDQACRQRCSNRSRRTP